MKWLFSTLFALALVAAGCRSGEHFAGPTTPTASGNTVGQGDCSLTIIILGGSTVIRGEPGASIVVGGVTINFNPDCSSTVVTTTETGHVQQRHAVDGDRVMIR
jgi:hypothetical protein